MEKILMFLFAIILFVDTSPIVVSTWNDVNATYAAWTAINEGDSALDAVELACSWCEMMQCRGSVGFGGHPDENGETTLDAMIMDGTRMNVGAVGGLRRIKRAVSVARRVMENTDHTFLVGDAATHFAVRMHFTEEPLQTPQSLQEWHDWVKNKCQPNFWTDVVPDARSSCGPYTPIRKPYKEKTANMMIIDINNHDTIGVVGVDKKQRIAAATSTNGLRHKIPGRVGDSPIVGAGAYADDSAGAAAATGDGDVLMRFLPSFLAVEKMREGFSPSEAASLALQRILHFYPLTSGGVVAVNNAAEHGAACIGMSTFPYTFQMPGMHKPSVIYVPCLSNKIN